MLFSIIVSVSINRVSFKLALVSIIVSVSINSVSFKLALVSIIVLVSLFPILKLLNYSDIGSLGCRHFKNWVRGQSGEQILVFRAAGSKIVVSRPTVVSRQIVVSHQVVASRQTNKTKTHTTPWKLDVSNGADYLREKWAPRWIVLLFEHLFIY